MAADRATDAPHDPALDAKAEHDVVFVRHAVQGVLRVGLVASFLLMATGLIMKIAGDDHRSAAVRLFDLGGSMTAGDRVMAIGILVLAATPAFRVFALVGLWAWERDWRFVAVALVVACTLVAAVVVGHG